MNANQSRIFLVGEHGKIVSALSESPYAAEKDLQCLLADNPELLPGTDMSGSPQHWLLIARELGVPNGPDASNKWHIDHLFVDEAGTPTLVECKRSSDPRARREVVAQMLDYAANGVVYWSLEKIKASFEQTWRQRHKVPAKVLQDFLKTSPREESPITDETFWNRVVENLAKRRIRLVFVADEISRELKRLVEFMNETMSEVEVLAVEIRHYWREGWKERVLVPSLVGATERANLAKQRSTSPPKIDSSIFMGNASEVALPFYDQLFSEVKNLGGFINWGEVGFSVRFDKADRFEYYLDNHGVADDEKRNVLRNQVIQETGDRLVNAGNYVAKCRIDALNRDIVLKAAVNAFKRAIDAFD